MAQAEHVIIAIGALMIGASTKPSTSPVRAAHAEFVLAMAEHEPHPTPIDPEAGDLENRAEHLTKVFTGLLVYVRAILDDTAQNVSTYRFFSVAFAVLRRDAFAATVGFDALAAPAECAGAAALLRRTPGC